MGWKAILIDGGKSNLYDLPACFFLLVWLRYAHGRCGRFVLVMWFLPGFSTERRGLVCRDLGWRLNCRRSTTIDESLDPGSSIHIDIIHDT